MNHNQVLMSSDSDSGEIIISNDNVWKYTVKVASGGKSSVPITLYGLNNVEMNVDWGDGSSSTLSPEDYTETDRTASVHAYSTAGSYQISVECIPWTNIYITTTNAVNAIDAPPSSSANDMISFVSYFRETLISLDGAIPRVKGVKQFSTDMPSAAADEVERDNSFGSLFLHCTKLATLSGSLFSLNPHINTFTSCFEGCSSIVAIPNGLLHSNTAAKQFIKFFYENSKLEIIPGTLFEKCTEALDFEYVFGYCAKLIRIPAGLFQNQTKTRSFKDCFNRCAKLKFIPDGLFANTIAATNFQSAFRLTSVENIPADMFDNCISATSFRQCFSNAHVVSVPAGLFKNCNKATNFQSIFETNNYLVSVDKDAFIGATAATDMSSMFINAKNLESIPDGLFRDCPNVTTFQDTFKTCTKLTTIPENLFLNNTKVTSFLRTFNGCSAIGDFDIHIGSTKVSNASQFVPAKTGAVRNVYVPAGSTTESKFNSIASSCTLNIISE